jgi:hypothetical protein
MHRWRKTMVVFAITAALIVSGSGFQAVAQDQNPGEPAPAPVMLADFLLARPFGLAITALGAVIFMGSLPFSAFGGNTGAAYQKLVKEPAIFTFSRPLGSYKVEQQDGP